jgi:hypothetical protein
MPRKLSRRALQTWDKLGQWYGTRLSDNYGPTPPDDWAEVIDRTDDERLKDALLAVRRVSPIHPPTLGQLEASIPKRESGHTGPSKAERIANAMLRAHGPEMCVHQFAKIWTYFGPLTTFELMPKRTPPEYMTHPDPRGAVCPACEACGKPSYRVTLDQEVTQGVAA